MRPVDAMLTSRDTDDGKSDANCSVCMPPSDAPTTACSGSWRLSPHAPGDVGPPVPLLPPPAAPSSAAGAYGSMVNPSCRSTSAWHRARSVGVSCGNRARYCRPVAGSVAVGLVGEKGEPSTEMQMTRQWRVSIGLPAPTYSCHHPGDGSSALDATWLLWLKDGKMTTVRDGGSAHRPCCSTRRRTPFSTCPSVVVKSPGSATSVTDLGCHGRDDAVA